METLHCLMKPTMQPSLESMRVLRLMNGGLRIIQVRPDGEMDRVVLESDLVPRKPSEMSRVTIMPRPAYEYGEITHDYKETVSMFRQRLASLDREHEITKVEAFAVHPNGTYNLTPNSLTGNERHFTVYYCIHRLGAKMILQVRPEMDDVEDDFCAELRPVGCIEHVRGQEH